MKKILLSLALLPLSAVAGFAQESRQDVSLSLAGLIPPHVVGNTVQQDGTIGIYGALASYRYMLTPRSALEVNYQYNQDIQKYLTSFNAIRFPGRLPFETGGPVEDFGLGRLRPDFVLETTRGGGVSLAADQRRRDAAVGLATGRARGRSGLVASSGARHCSAGGGVVKLVRSG